MTQEKCKLSLKCQDQEISRVYRDWWVWLTNFSKFYDHLSNDCEVLRGLTHNKNMWEWSETHALAFQRLKHKIKNTPLLKYHNQEEVLTLQCDASDTGLGAALTQSGTPVAFGSRALTPTERGYTQIQKVLGHSFRDGKVSPVHLWKKSDSTK